MKLCLAKIPSAFSFTAFHRGCGLGTGRLLTVKTCDFSVGWSFGEAQVAIRTARWAAKAPGACLSDVDADLDREVDFAVRVADRVLHALLRKHPGLFPQRREPIYAPDEESPA